MIQPLVTTIVDACHEVLGVNLRDKSVEFVGLFLEWEDSMTQVCGLDAVSKALAELALLGPGAAEAWIKTLMRFDEVPSFEVALVLTKLDLARARAKGRQETTNLVPRPMGARDRIRQTVHSWGRD